ncbi:MAG TPA: phosphatase PAP2 family protein [Steroidobacteraceae bacterium]|nr:phosphatase PAP2 family protein [Steroidobacteraceae bacterium]
MVNKTPRTFTAPLAWAAACAIALGSGAARADNFLDHRLGKDTGGIYSLQDGVPISLGLLAAGCALWQGTTDRLGKTCWEAGESGVAAVVAAEALQFATGRQSPAATGDPNRWFSGGKGSFPSTHVSLTTAVVTPFIFQYFHDDPWVGALAVLPAYEMVARVRAREHWQTDVIAGAALGFAFGAYEAHRDNPLVFSLLPGGAYVGFHHSF